MEDSVSAFIVGTCRMLPRSNTNIFQSIRIQSKQPCQYYQILCGSSAEFYIQPQNVCIGDVDFMRVSLYNLAFTDKIPVLPHDLRDIADTTECFLIEPYIDYPVFVRLQRLGQMSYNWKRKIFEFRHYSVPEMFETTKMFPSEAFVNVIEIFRAGPAFKFVSERNFSFDIVESIWCPQWPKVAKDWPFRRRKYGWPTTAIIYEVVQNGCNVVFATHPACRDDVHQCRLSFSVAEVILIQSWTPVQQIVYHLLRFFAKRELIKSDCAKKDELLCTYHFKTLILWSCEEMSPEWWNSSSVIKICCNLLRKLSEWLKKQYLPNYFVPRANLFNDQVNWQIVDEITKKLLTFCDSNILCHWFVKHYMQPILLHVPKARHIREDLRCVSECMLLTCEATEEFKRKSIDIYFMCRYPSDIQYLCDRAQQKRGLCEYGLCTSVKYHLRQYFTVLWKRTEFLPSTDIESCFEVYASMLLILHAAHLIDCMKKEYNSEWFVDVVSYISTKSTLLKSMHHNFPKPWKTVPDRSQLYVSKAQDLMENLTGSSDDLEYKLVSQMSKNVLMKALECEEFKASTNTSATLAYMAGLHYGASEYETAIDLCLRLIIKQTPEDMKKETLNAGCLFYIDDVVRIIGFYLIFRRIQGNFQYNRRLQLLDLRLTPEVFAHYLIISSNERIPEAFRRDIPNVLQMLSLPLMCPLDALLVTMTYGKSSRISQNFESVLRVHQETDPINILEEPMTISFLSDSELICLLRQHALEYMTSFYNTIWKDFNIRCNIVDCYRAAYLYKCRNYPEVLNMCEQIINKPDLESELKEFAFANVMVLPPLDSYFDTDVQCLLGFHTLYCYLSPLNEDLERIDNANLIFQYCFARMIFTGKLTLPYVLECTSSAKCHYFLGRHFLARYLKVRCLIDSKHSNSEILFEFKQLRSNLPFEQFMRCFLRHKLRRFEKGINAIHNAS